MDVSAAKCMAAICVRGGTHITGEMCSRAHIPWGNTYHCNTEPKGNNTSHGMFVLFPDVIKIYTLAP